MGRGIAKGTEVTAWPFQDPPNFIAFSTRQVFEGKQPILAVYHRFLGMIWTLQHRDSPVSTDDAPIPFSGRATFKAGTLRVEGKARYPNDFSTATLKPLLDVPVVPSTCLAFALVFNRDKEPFCGPDLIGPVVYYARAAGLEQVDVVRVYVTPDIYEDVHVER
jgi:hypothetical protein